MKRHLFLALALLITGCGSLTDDEAGNNHSYGDGVDSVGASGLRVQYAAELDPDIDYMFWLENTFLRVQQCTGLTAPPPFVVIGDVEKTYFNPPLVIVKPDLSALPHEYVHYFLVYAGEPSADNSNHVSNLFVLCGYPLRPTRGSANH